MNSRSTKCGLAGLTDVRTVTALSIRINMLQNIAMIRLRINVEGANAVW